MVVHSLVCSMALYLVFLVVAFRVFDSKPGHFIHHHSFAYVDLDSVPPMGTLGSLRAMECAYTHHRGEVMSMYGFIDTPVRQATLRHSITGIVRLTCAEEVNARNASGVPICDGAEPVNKQQCV